MSVSGTKLAVCDTLGKRQLVCSKKVYTHTTFGMLDFFTWWCDEHQQLLVHVSERYSKHGCQSMRFHSDLGNAFMYNYVMLTVYSVVV